jgi:hypothetical protein
LPIGNFHSNGDVKGDGGMVGLVSVFKFVGNEIQPVGFCDIAIIVSFLRFVHRDFLPPEKSPMEREKNLTLESNLHPSRLSAQVLIILTNEGCLKYRFKEGSGAQSVGTGCLARDYPSHQ